MKIVAGYDVALSRWAASHIPHVERFGPCVALGIATETDRLLAVWVFHEMVYETIQISAAAIGRTWARPDIIHRLFAYPFEQLQMRKVWTVTPSTNTRALDINKRLGMKEEAVLRHQFADGVHGVFHGMTAREYLSRYGVLAPLRNAA